MALTLKKNSKVKIKLRKKKNVSCAVSDKTDKHTVCQRRGSLSLFMLMFTWA